MERIDDTSSWSRSDFEGLGSSCEPRNVSGLEGRGAKASDLEAVFEEVDEPPPQVWTRIERELRREGLISS